MPRKKRQQHEWAYLPHSITYYKMDYDRLKSTKTLTGSSFAPLTNQLSPQELHVYVKDLFCEWVNYSAFTKGEIMEILVLEQFFKVLYLNMVA